MCVCTYVRSRASCTAWFPFLCCSLQDHLFKQIAHLQAMSHTHPHTRHSHTHTFPCTVRICTCTLQYVRPTYCSMQCRKWSYSKACSECLLNLIVQYMYQSAYALYSICTYVHMHCTVYVHMYIHMQCTVYVRMYSICTYVRMQSEISASASDGHSTAYTNIRTSVRVRLIPLMGMVKHSIIPYQEWIRDKSAQPPVPSVVHSFSKSLMYS